MTTMYSIATKEELSNIIQSIRCQPFRMQQIWHAIYHQGCIDFTQMLTIPLELRTILASIIKIPRLHIKKELISADGTIKWLLQLEDKNDIETVFIPETTRGTVCVSSQIGCTLTCTFCHTGTQPLVRNLSANEILAQVMVTKDKIEDWPVINDKKLTNIVFMGMGEPMLNYDNVATSIRTLTDQSGLNYGKKRITISTSGLLPQILQSAKELGVRLAVSLHAVHDDIRNELVPINKKYPIKELLEVCKVYANQTGNERITFEYVMLDGINDSDSEARFLVQLLKNIPAKVNLIPFNPWPNSPYKCSPKDRIKKFAAIIAKAGYTAPIRLTRGQDIMAACGQLKSDSIKVKKSLRG